MFLCKDYGAIYNIMSISLTRLIANPFTPSLPRFQYVCSHCQTVLKSTANQEISEIDVPSLKEACPNCGDSLSQTLEIRRLKPVVKMSLPQQQQQQRPPPQFQIASEVPVLTFDLKSLDGFFYGLRRGDVLYVLGEGESLLASRLCVRALLPKKNRSGGLDSKVLFIDAGNDSDVYQCISFARQYGLDIKKMLDGIVVSRVFTIYQLARLVTQELANAIKRFDAGLVVLSCLFTMFLQDPRIDPVEAKSLLQYIMLGIKKVADGVVTVITARQEAAPYTDILSYIKNRIDVQPSAKGYVVDAKKDCKTRTFVLHARELRLAAGV